MTNAARLNSRLRKFLTLRIRKSIFAPRLLIRDSRDLINWVRLRPALRSSYDLIVTGQKDNDKLTFAPMNVPAAGQVSHRFQMPDETAWDFGAILIFDKIKPALGGQFIWNLAQDPLPCLPAQNSLMRKLVKEEELRHD